MPHLLWRLAVVTPSTSAPPPEFEIGAEPIGGDTPAVMQETLQGLVEEAKARDSSALAVVREGGLLIDWAEHGDQPIELMSCTKLIVAITAGAAIGARAVDLLDAPLATVVPDWSGLPPSVTLSSLLSHASGLKPVAAYEVYRAEDIVAQALALPYDETLVGRNAYNNSAINLVGGLVAHLSGQPFADAAADALFRPLGWSRWNWQRDVRGNAYCFAGLEATARDAARAADLLLHDPSGLLPEGWAEAVRTRGLSCYGQPAWINAEITEELLAEWTGGGVDSAIVAAARPMIGRSMEFGVYFAELTRRLGEAGLKPGDWGAQVAGGGLRRAHVTSGDRVGAGHDGDGGQQLLVLPDHGVAACRLRIVGPEADRAGPAMWSSFPGALAAAVGS